MNTDRILSSFPSKTSVLIREDPWLTSLFSTPRDIPVVVPVITMQGAGHVEA
jgi:hypothetical protein